MKIKVIKDIYIVHCTPTIFVPIKDDEVTFKEDFHLITTIKHTGNLNRSHYTWFIMILNLESWFHCNDTAVPKTIFHLIITSTNQINFFCISYCELEYLSLSSCVMTRHVNPVFVHFFHCFVRRLGYLIMSLGVTTLHITPVMLTCMAKMLLHFWWFAPSPWHVCNCEHNLLKSCCGSFNWWFK